jgi:hypothetical protein
MSSCVCKRAEGTVSPLLPFVVAIEDGIDDAVDAGHIDGADHGPGAASHLHEAALDDLGGAQLAPQVAREAEEREQFG